MRRRTFLLGAAAVLVAGNAPAQPEPGMLRSAPLDLQGDWGKSLPASVATVVARMRDACLAGTRLVSDRQPRGLRVENRAPGNPAIWLHPEPAGVAWVVVAVGERDWCRLAYQFGHELGHVLANSWSPDSKPQEPCQWLEESLVEAFSLRGLAKLADSWEQRPPFTDDAPFADAIRRYQREVVERYAKVASEEMAGGGVDAWFGRYRSALEHGGGRSDPAHAAVPMLLRELQADTRNVEDIGALNRWAERSAVPIERYLGLWQRSCGEVGAAGALPKRLAGLMGVRCAT